MRLRLTALKAVGLRFRQEEWRDLGRQVRGIADSSKPAGDRCTIKILGFACTGLGSSASVSLFFHELSWMQCKTSASGKGARPASESQIGRGEICIAKPRRYLVYPQVLDPESQAPNGLL